MADLTLYVELAGTDCPVLTFVTALHLLDMRAALQWLFQWLRGILR